MSRCLAEGVMLVTGADGFVGTAVREAALRRGLSVRATSRRPKAGQGMHFLDVLESDTLDAPMEGVTTLIHAAGAAHVFRRTAAAADWIQRTNVDGTRNVVAAARRAGVRHVVLISSVSATGEPHDVYGESKLAAERAAMDAAGQGLTLTILRLATVYGEGDRGNVLRLVRAIDRRRFVWIGDGENRKSLIHRDDAGAAIIVATTTVARGLFTVSAPPVRMRDVVAAIASALGRSLPRLSVSSRAAKLVARAFDVLPIHGAGGAGVEGIIAKWCTDDVHDGSEFCVRFGFAPAVALADGIAREVDWYRRSRRT